MQKTNYKQTEIGEVPKVWEIRKVKDLGKVITGKTPPTKESKYFGRDYPFIKIPDMGCSVRIRNVESMLSHEGAQYMRNLKLPPGAVMVSCLATIGKVGITTEESFTNQQINTIIPNVNKVIPEWIYYFFKNNTKYLESLGGGGSVYTNISKTRFENAYVVLPTLAEQRAIAKILSDLDEKIELNHQMNKTLESIAQAIFKRWFVEFEFPNENGKPYKSSGGKMVDSEVGEIPEGWEVKSLDQIADFLNGLALQKYPPRGNKYLPVIKIRELNQGITESTDKASPEIDTEYIVDDGDILFSWSGSLQVCIWCQGKGALNQHLFKVSSSEYPKWFYFYWVKFHLPEFQHIAQGKATTMGHIQRHHLSSALVVVPPKNILTTMNKTMAPLVEQIIINGTEIRQLSQTRDSILPKLMLGKIRVNTGG